MGKYWEIHLICPDEGKDTIVKEETDNEVFERGYKKGYDDALAQWPDNTMGSRHM